MNADVLQGWKVIAGYLDRDERTVRRWEKQHGLPVRRLTTDRRSVVYALPSELDRWLREPRGAQAQLPSPTPDVSPPAEIPAADNSSQRRLVPIWQRPETRVPVTLAILIVLACLAAGFQIHKTGRNAAVANTAREEPPLNGDLDEAVTEGELLLDRRTPEAMNRAVEILTQRTQVAPNDALAFAALSKALCLVREYSTVPSAVAYPSAEAAAKRALSLDPANSDALASFAFIDFFWRWDAPSAERHFRRAIELQPASATARQWYGSMLLHQGRTHEALEQLNKAQRLAPSSVAIMSTRAMGLALSGQRSTADELLAKLEQDAPEALPPYRTGAYLSLQRPANLTVYLDQMERFDRLRGDRAGVAEVAHARKLFRAQGQEAMLLYLLKQERLRSANQQYPSFRVARMEALLGETEAARHDVLMAVKSHDEGSIALFIDPVFDNLRYQGKLNDALRLLPVSLKN